MEEYILGNKSEKHLYDLDVIELYYKIDNVLRVIDSSQLGFSKEEYLDVLKQEIESVCKNLKLDFQYLFNQKLPLILPSTETLYHRFLAINLAFYDLPKINLFLNHQKKHFKGNYYAEKNNFVGLIEFTCYKTIGDNSLIKTDERLGKIMSWVEKEKEKPEYENIEIADNDHRIKGRLPKEEIEKYWMQLSDFPNKKGIRVRVLTPDRVRNILHANFYGFDPPIESIKYFVTAIKNGQLKKFVREFHQKHNNTNRTDEYIHLLKNNFSNFDDTTFESLKKNFSK